MSKKIISLLAASLALLNPASAQTFSADSDVINNQYTPLPAGAVAFYTGYGTELGQSIASWTNRVSVVGADMVNGIHSMKVVARRTGIATDIIHWYAQDTDGNVWLVQHGSGPTPDQTQFLCMPATLDVGSTFAGLDAEQLDEFTVESLSETVSTPLHVFNNCVKGTNSDFGNHQVLYFRPNLGLAKTYLTNNTDNAGFQLASVHGITVDLTPPALTLLSPSANQHWTNNSTFTVTGKASDNAAVSAVQVSADGINWSDATSGDNFTNWTADVNLAAGTNIIRAYAIDANGNHSLTNKASMVSVLNDGPAPASPAGMTFFQTAAAAAPPFDFPNFGLVFFANTGSTFTSGGVMDGSVVTATSGAYSYVQSNADGLITAANHVGSFIGDYTFDDAASGSYLLTQNSTGGFQSGGFQVFSGQAPASLAGKTFYATTVDHGGGDDFSGISTIVFISSTTAIRTNSTGSNTVTYTYSIVNKSTGKVVFSHSGQTTTAFISFTDASSGLTASHNTSGGWEINTFTIPDTTRPTVTITAPVANQRWSNDVFTVTGRAGDDVGVADVLVSTDGINWTDATTTNNWTNWTADVTLTPGPNTNYAYAIDTSGNHSITSTVKNLTYILSAPLVVRTNPPGWGMITPNYNNALLQVGANYSLTATPKPGFMFTNWTDCSANLITNKPTLLFQMQSNLCFTANFIDVTRPTLNITNLAPPFAVSNELFTVKGRAGDNVGVANVFYRLTNSLTDTGWNPANSGNNFTNWSADLDLTPGTNFISGYAVDAAGNASPTSTVKFVYILSAPMCVSTNGNGGGIAPSYNNVLLQIGANYAMTATAKPGFAFTNWTDGDGAVVTNKPGLKFTMASNLCYTANFVDIAKPTVSITNLPTNGNVSNELFTIKGRAGDNVGVANVFYRLTNNLADTGWLPASTANNFTNWSADLDLTPGTNFFSVYALDVTGNRSATNTVRMVYVLSATLTVSTNGKGSISPAYNGARLQIGRSYTLTATPGTGFVFTNWTDGSGTIITNKPALTFIMASNLSFTANFIDVSRPVVTITAPLASTVAVGEFFNASGRASDNAGVTNVQYQVNNGGWFTPNTTNNWTNWTVTIDLTPGTNIFSAYAADTSGNLSVTSTVKFAYGTAPATLSGFKAQVTPDSSSLPFDVAFGASTFSQESTGNPDNGNGVGSYTYTRLTPSTGRLKVTYTAPPSATNEGNNPINLYFGAPGQARFTNDVSGHSGGITFTSTPTLVIPSLVNQTVVYVNDQGEGGSTRFTTSQTIKVDPFTQATHSTGKTYTYATYGPVGALVKQTGSNTVNYTVVTFHGTNYGTAYSEEYDQLGNFTGTNVSVFGLASQRPGGNAPTNLVSRTAWVATVDSIFKLSFDTSTFAQLSPVDDSLTNNVGTYVYARVATNTGSLDLNFTAPPDAASLLLLFASPNFALFTNNADSTIGAAVLK